MTYQEQINHPKWQKKRLEVMKLRGFRCQKCGAEERQLHVHHPHYRHGAMIWEYETEFLQCLCDECHKEAHGIKPKSVYVEPYITPLESMRRYREKCIAAKKAATASHAYPRNPNIESDAAAEAAAEEFFRKMKLMMLEEEGREF